MNADNSRVRKRSEEAARSLFSGAALLSARKICAAEYRDDRCLIEGRDPAMSRWPPGNATSLEGTLYALSITFHVVYPPGAWSE